MTTNWLYSTFNLMPADYIMSIDIKDIGRIFIDNDNHEITLTINRSLYQEDVIQDIISILKNNNYSIGPQPKEEYKSILRRRRASDSSKFNISPHLLSSIFDILLSSEKKIAIEMRSDGIM